MRTPEASPSARRGAATWLVALAAASACGWTACGPGGTTPVSQLAWDFEDGLQGWTPEGDAFTGQPIDGPTILTNRVIRGTRYAAVRGQLSVIGGDYWNVPYPISIQGRRWIGTAEFQLDTAGIPNLERLTAYPSSFETFRTFARLGESGDPLNGWEGWPRGYWGDELTGKLTSPEFTLNRRYVHALLGGHCEPELVGLRVEALNTSGAWSTIATLSPPECDEVMRRVSFDLDGYEGERLRLVIFDIGEGPGEHVNVDDVRVSGRVPANETSVIWGWADAHAHPMSHLAFGERVVWGAPDEPLAECPGTDHAQNQSKFAAALIQQMEETLEPPPPGGGLFAWLGGLLEGLVNLAGVQDLADCLLKSYGHAETPLEYTRWQNLTHQTMHVDWIKRAYEGGLRLMVADAVNSRLLDFATSNPATFDPESDSDSYIRQVVAMRTFVENNSDWMEIALSPAHARTIIESNKLAIVLGIEVDSFGDCDIHDKEFETGSDFTVASTSRCTIDEFRDHLSVMRDLGVRQVQLVHLADNQFGGSGISNDLFNANNFFLNGEFYETAEEYQSGAGIDFALGQNMTLAERACMLMPLTEDADPGAEPNRASVNQRGLTPFGRQAILEMQRQGVILAADHLGQRALDGVLDIYDSRFDADNDGSIYAEVQQDGYATMGSSVYPQGCETSPVREACFALDGWPIAFTHTGFRELALAGTRAAHQKTAEQRRRVLELGGIVAPGFTAGNVYDAILATGGTSMLNEGDGIPNTCAGTASAYAQLLDLLYQEWVGLGFDITKLGVPLGTDLNGLNGSVPVSCVLSGSGDVYSSSGLVPDAALGRQWNIHAHGVAHYGMLPDFLQDLRYKGATSPDLRPLFLGAEAYIRMWENICGKSDDPDTSCRPST